MNDLETANLLKEITTTIAKGGNQEALLNSLLSNACKIIPFDAATFFVYRAKSQLLVAAATHPYGDQLRKIRPFAIGEGIAGWAVRNKTRVVVNDAQIDARFIRDSKTVGTPRSVAVLPIEGTAGLTAALMVSRHTVNPFTELECSILELLATQAALAGVEERIRNDLEARIVDSTRHTSDLESRLTQITLTKTRQTDFLSNVSHELRTPLHAILGFTELLQDDLSEQWSGSERKEVLAKISIAGHHLLDMINAVLDLSRVSADSMPLNVEVLAVDDLTREVCVVLEGLAAERGLRFDLRLPGELDRVDGDRTKLRQVIYNLLSNAVKFSHRDSVITITIEQDHTATAITVESVGEEIPEVERERIFEEFYQVSNGEQPRGSGLGLPLARSFIELLGGGLDLSSPPGPVTAFTAILPRLLPGVDAKGLRLPSD